MKRIFEIECENKAYNLTANTLQEMLNAWIGEPFHVTDMTDSMEDLVRTIEANEENANVT